jgi:hypothetical protein
MGIFTQSHSGWAFISKGIDEGKKVFEETRKKVQSVFCRCGTRVEKEEAVLKSNGDYHCPKCNETLQFKS